jgi:hypothetical protein
VRREWREDTFSFVAVRGGAISASSINNTSPDDSIARARVSVASIRRLN